MRDHKSQALNDVYILNECVREIGKLFSLKVNLLLFKYTHTNTDALMQKKSKSKRELEEKDM